MSNIILYIDCDGVIFDTIKEAYKMMDELNLDRNCRKDVNNFFKYQVNWYELFNRANELNNAIDKIKILKDSKEFKDVIILTKLSGNYFEEKVKRDLFNKILPDVRVITLEYSLKKDCVVIAKDNILIDDELPNILSWEHAGGIGLHYQQNITDYENNILSNLLDIDKTEGVKRLLKTRHN